MNKSSMEDLNLNQGGVVLEQEIDYFDGIPDPIVLVILNKVYYARSLCRCLAVSKRFASLVTEVGSVCVSMNYQQLKKPIEDGSKSRNGSKSVFKNLVCKFLTKPFNFLQQTILSNKKLLGSSSVNGVGSGTDIFNRVGEVLKNFKDVESIELELPCNGGEIGINKSMPLLKWEAGFGKGMEMCVILGATSISNRNDGDGKKNGKKLGSCNENEEEHMFSDDQLRLRIIWIISCLISSSGRHNLMKKLVGQCSKLSEAVISDAGMHGKLHMNAVQIRELRCSIDSTNINLDDSPSPRAGTIAPGGAETTPPAQMGYVGNLVMKLWYVKELELPISGQIMKGATLVVIKPENKVGISGKECDEVNLCGSFEGDNVFEEASNELFKRKEKRVYRLEVNSF